MAYYSMHAYDADVWIERFLGIRQDDDELHTDIRYAAEAENVETPKGILQPHAAHEVLLGQFNGAKIETLASFYRRWYKGVGSKEWLICAAGGKLYYRQEDYAGEWTQIPMPAGVTAFQSNVWSWVTYETNVEDADYPIDVLVLSNARDGMLMVIPPDRPKVWDDLMEQTWTTVKANTWGTILSPAWTIRTISIPGDKKFGVIERYADRIWGGDIADNPDMLMYSAPYDPTDWEVNTDIPEDGAGDVLQPSWDGDSFTSLKAFGDQLVAFKEHRVWRIFGTNPGEYTFKEQFGGGAPFYNTIVVHGERILMADTDGLSIFDGMNVSPYVREQIGELWRRVNRSAMSQMCAAIHKDQYYLSVPIDGSTVNNAMIVVNLISGTVLFYNDLKIESFLANNNHLYATSSDLPGKTLILNYDSWVTGKAAGSATKWVSPWIDFGYKRIQKGGFELYFTPEVQNEPVTLTISVQTEKKKKTKNYTVQPLNVVAPGKSKTWEQATDASWGAFMQHTWGDISGKVDETVRKFRHKRLHFSGTGRRFRVIIETAAGVTAPWRLIGGIQMVVETDPD